MKIKKFLMFGWLAMPIVLAAMSNGLFAATGDDWSGFSAFRMESVTEPTAPSDGQIWNSSTYKSIVRYENGVKEWSGGVIYSSTGSVISTTTFPSVLLFSTITANTSSFNGTITLPANYFVAGKMIRYSVLGTLSTAGAASGATMNWAVRLGTTTIGQTGNQVWPVGLSSVPFSLNGVLSCLAAGSFVLGVSSATTNFVINVASGTSQLPVNSFIVGNSTTNVAQINTTQANDLNIVWSLAQASVGNVLVTNSIIYENLN